MVDNNYIKYEVSVVIPSVGEDILNNTIDALNSGSIVPKEIIVSIPKNLKGKVDNLKQSNVKILPLNIKGQVKQRIEGFKISKYKYVLQLDSDVIVAKKTIENLILALKKLDNKVAVSPVIQSDGINPLLINSTKISLISKCTNLVIDGKTLIPAGVITKAGIQSSPFPNPTSENLIKTEWLPGACVMHYKNNLILENYYPYEGKAYGEDVIHSILLKKKGIKLYVCYTTKAIHEGVIDKNEFTTFKELYGYILINYRYKSLIVNHTNGNRLRFSIWICFFCIKHIMRYLKSKLSF